MTDVSTIAAFCRNVPKNAAVVLVTSGSTQSRHYDANEPDLANGRYGALRAEEFLHYGFYVVFLHSKGSRLPFMSRAPRLDSEMSACLRVSAITADASDSGVVTLEPSGTTSEFGPLVADLRARDAYRKSGALLQIEFDEISGTDVSIGYLPALRVTLVCMHSILGERGRLILCLLALLESATVSQRAGPNQSEASDHTELDTHAKTSSQVTPISDLVLTCAPSAFFLGNETPTVTVDNAVQRYLAWLVQREQFHIHGTVNQFRNQALAGVAACDGRGYRGKSAQCEIAEGDAGDNERASNVELPLDSHRCEHDGFVYRELVTGQFLTGCTIGIILGYVVGRVAARLP